MARSKSKLFYTLLTLLMIDALFEMSFIAATVSFLHNRAGGAFDVTYEGRMFSLHGKPVHLLVDQGHASNGAAGTALILIGFGGLLTFPFLRAKAGTMSRYASIMSTAWLTLASLSMLFSFSVLVATMIITADHADQTIDVALASGLNNKPYPDYVAYPLGWWTPENWFAAVLEQDLALESDRALIRTKYRVIKGWRWNLIPMFILGVAVFSVGLLEIRRWKGAMKRGDGMLMHDRNNGKDAAWGENGIIPNMGTGNGGGHKIVTPATPMLSSITRKPLLGYNVGGTEEGVRP